MRAPDHLSLTLRYYPANPAFALWRAIELRKLSQLYFEEPILDLGCGDGRFAEMLFGVGREVYGLDVSPADVALANVSAAFVTAVCGDATQLPFPAQMFGSVLANCVLEHIPEDLQAVREMARVVKPGGSVVFTVPGPDLHRGLYNYQLLLAKGRAGEAADYLRAIDRRLAHYHYHSADDWRGILAEAGLEVERIEPYLAAPALAIWDRIDNFLYQPVVVALDSWKLALYILTPRRIRTWLAHRFLSRLYRLDDSNLYGCLLIAARKQQ